MKRSYAQLCGIARALDVVGDRWTLLLIRDLLLGPRRYSDLLASLEGITTNLLASRLARLEDDRVIARVPLPAPARGHAYALTEHGRRLEPALLALGAFGGELALDPAVPYRGDPRWAVVSFKRRFRGTRHAFSVTLRVEDAVFHLRGDPADGLAVGDGDGPATAATLRCSAAGFGRLYRGDVLSALEEEGLVTVEGRRGDVRAFLASVGLRGRRSGS